MLHTQSSLWSFRYPRFQYSLTLRVVNRYGRQRSLSYYRYFHRYLGHRLYRLCLHQRQFDVPAHQQCQYLPIHPCLRQVGLHPPLRLYCLFGPLDRHFALALHHLLPEVSQHFLPLGQPSGY